MSDDVGEVRIVCQRCGQPVESLAGHFPACPSGDVGHGEWVKEQQRYEDGCKHDAPPHGDTRPPHGSPEELPWLRGIEAATLRCREKHGDVETKIAAVWSLVEEWEREGQSLITHAYSGGDVYEGQTMERLAAQLRTALNQ